MKSRDKEAVARAEKMMEYFSKDDMVFGDGRRNVDGVEFGIACRVLGYDTSISDIKVRLMEISSTMCKVAKVGDSRWIRTRNKLAIVYTYLKEWGPDGNEERALEYCLRPEKWYDEKLKLLGKAEDCDKRKEDDEQTA